MIKNNICVLNQNEINTVSGGKDHNFAGITAAAVTGAVAGFRMGGLPGAVIGGLSGGMLYVIYEDNAKAAICSMVSFGAGYGASVTLAHVTMDPNVRGAIVGTFPFLAYGACMAA